MIPEKVEQLLINTENIDELIAIIRRQETTPELIGYEDEIYYLSKLDESTIYALWLEV